MPVAHNNPPGRATKIVLWHFHAECHWRQKKKVLPGASIMELACVFDNIFIYILDSRSAFFVLYSDSVIKPASSIPLSCIIFCNGSSVG